MHGFRALKSEVIMSNMTNAAPHTPIQEADYSAIHPPSLLKRLELTNPVFWLSGSFLSLFVLLALTNTESLTAMVNAGFGFATKYFGAYWQVLLLLNFLIGLALAFGRTGCVRLGGLAKPDIDTFKWLSIVLCTLLAGGGVFGLLPSQLLTLLQRHLCMVKLHQKLLQSMRYLSRLCTGDFWLGRFSVAFLPSY